MGARLAGRALSCLALLAIAAPVSALSLQSVEIRGIDDPVQRANVRAALALERLNPNRRKQLSESRLAFLLRQVPDQVRGAMEPLGYYDADAGSEVQRSGDMVTVVVTVTPGEPVRVTRHELQLRGPAAQDPALAKRLRRFRPGIGDILEHGVYEQSKADMARVLGERGYFDAELAERRVEVSRADRSASLHLLWEGGQRYRLGEARFSGHGFRPGLLENLVGWRPGDEYRQSRLLALQRSLSDLDYFAVVDVQPLPEEARDGRVPVQVTLSPGKRDVYSAGLRYGTDTGLGVTAGLERRWVNDRGHKLLARAAVAERERDLTLQYRIPAFAWLDGWYTLGASARQQPIADFDNELVEFVGSRTGGWRDWRLAAALNLRRERYEDPLSVGDFRYSTLVFPSLWARWSSEPERLDVRRGLGLTFELRGGHSGLGSDIDFLQLRAEGRWIRPLGPRNRLLLRGELGTTLTDDFQDLPPSLRFHAGGDGSVRGYGYQEIGEFVIASNGERYVLGGQHLVVASVEVERMFSRDWGAALFVDAGDAFDSDGAGIDLQWGIGVGLRWRSPVGPVRVDLAHGLGDDAGQTLRLHLGIGAEL